MATSTINIRIAVPRDIDRTITRWAKLEKRSKRRHVGMLIEKLAELKRTNAGDLKRLGLLDQRAVA
jgi:hypothetical protein